MECTVKWLDGMSFIAETGTGHIVAMDGAPDAGGRNLAPRPMELLLAGAGGCTAFDGDSTCPHGAGGGRGPEDPGFPCSGRSL